MSRYMKSMVFFVLVLAILFGFAGAFGLEHDGYPFKYLHVFLFNLTAGGLLLVTLFGGSRPGRLQAMFLGGALAFAVGAFFDLPFLNVACALFLAAIVERLRWKNFAWFPYEFFRTAPASKKFGQAALLCLSLGLIICAATIVNNEYLKLIDLGKLDLHVFFLGFSFPISLITYSLVFERAEGEGASRSALIDEFCFWGLNLGVIVFFVFIILGIYPMQLVMALLLFATVWMTIYVHVKYGRRGPEWGFLVSALCFLVIGSSTGIIYIIELWRSAHYPAGYLLSLHSAANLFGWNLTWMMLFTRRGEYPLKAGLKILVPLHWGFVLLIPPGREYPLFAIVAFVLFTTLLGLAFFSPSIGRTETGKSG